MPIYEYHCSSCGHETELLQKMSDAPLTVCPACGKATFNKRISAAGFQLKGSGWYATDFRGGSRSGANAGKDTGGAKPESGSESKPKEEAKGDASASTGGATSA